MPCPAPDPELTESNTSQRVLVEADARNQVDAMDLMDMKAPQPRWRDLIEAGGFVEFAPGVGMTFDRPSTEFITRNHKLFSSRVDVGLGNARPLIPLNIDPPLHAKYRKLLDPLFAPKRMDAQEEGIARWANRFIDTFIDRGECNLSDEFADLFPASVFLDLCGLPEEELEMFLHMRDGILHPERIDPHAAVDFDRRMEVAKRSAGEIYAYFGNLADERRAEPRDDLISLFVQHEIDGEKLTKEDIEDISFLFVIAGLDTVSDALTCFYAFLAQHPDHRRQIVEEPAIIPTAVEELLRWESPVPQSVGRVATEDVELPNGRSVSEGTIMVLSYGAANISDPDLDDPFEVRFDRKANPHYAFGGGVHRCLGSHLARRELRVALREWHRRIPEYRIKPGHEDLEYPPGLRHVKDLMLTWA